MDKIFIIAEGTKVTTAGTQQESSSQVADSENSSAKSNTSTEHADTKQSAPPNTATEPVTEAEVVTIVDQQLAPFGSDTGIAVGVMMGITTLTVLLCIALFYLQSKTAQSLTRMRDSLNRELRGRDKETKNLREAIERLGGMVTENRDAIAEARHKAPVEPIKVAERVQPDPPAPPAARVNPLDEKYKAFITDYNALLTLAGQGMNERNRRDELIAKYTGLVGIECINAAERMNNMKLEPVFRESKNLITANYWLLPLDSYGCALVPSGRLLGDDTGSRTTALERFYDTLGHGDSCRIAEAALVDGVSTLNVKRKGTLERS